MNRTGIGHRALQVEGVLEFGIINHDHLAAHDATKAELVKLRFFTGLTLEESAEVLGFSLATAKRSCSLARAWLFREIKRLQAEV